ncbi:CPBP family intramembrane metalloprotease [Myroides ceti]|uniref:CPBP family intramembrane metalloprotease n=1 Tax=Paenimyroides ceti TaxID=395087 RepID=A0ABT8CNW2_9FLAO|nr:CPBP family intramembrane glutamic endopeptidase [Paenimyroides ceti]MDN3705851.1 CPBP family intramembrane metalloprotease [Paenimyroides ceti]
MKNKNKNWILYSGIVAVLLGLVVLWSTKTEYYHSRLNMETNFITLLFFSIIIAPVFEELAFRGYFTRSKKIQIPSLILLLVYVLISFNFINLILFLAILTFILLNNGKENNLIFFFSILLFGTIHYQVSDFTSLSAFYTILFQLGLGAILLWVVINFNLKRAVLLHALFNLVMLSFTYFSIMYKTDFSEKRIENDTIHVVWKKEFNLYPKNESLILTDNSFKAQNYTPLSLYKALQNNKSSNKIKNLFIKEPLMNYSIDFSLKDSLNVDNDELAKKYLQFCIDNGILKDVTDK